jgi:hypothetical protein
MYKPEALFTMHNPEALLKMYNPGALFNMYNPEALCGRALDSPGRSRRGRAVF